MNRLCFSRLAAAVIGLSLAVPSPGFAQINYPVPIPVLKPIRITSPANHAVFYAPVDIPIFAFVDPVGFRAVTNVEFYAGTNKLGEGFNLGGAFGKPPPVGVYYPLVRTTIPALPAIYCFVWSNAPVGNYALTAVARTALVAAYPESAITSAPVNISVLVSPVPTNNPPDVVSIVATDPIAISGTNHWFWPGPTNVLPSWSNWPPPILHSFTNWGPKDAVFTVRRFGDASQALNVNYAVSGTATNGTNYAELPGSVTIPAGGAYALIPVVPIDVVKTNRPLTVVLTLTASSNSPPDYTVGVPMHAEALILSSWPRPLPFLLPDGSFHLNAAGPDGAWFCVQKSTNLADWLPVCTNQVFSGSLDFVDPDAAGGANGYYRAVPVLATPTQ